MRIEIETVTLAVEKQGEKKKINEMHLCHLKSIKTKEIIHHASATTDHYEIQKWRGDMTDFAHELKNL